MNKYSQLVFDYLLCIPSGKVVTYQDIALVLGNKHLCRVIGNILHHNPNTHYYPCHKVVNAKGQLAKNFKDGIEIQKQRLENDGVEVINYQVDLRKYHWQNALELLNNACYNE